MVRDAPGRRDHPAGNDVYVRVEGGHSSAHISGGDSRKITGMLIDGSTGKVVASYLRYAEPRDLICPVTAAPFADRVF